MKFRKKYLSKNEAILGLYPVYADNVYKGKEPFKVVGIRENSLELQGDYSGGTHTVCQNSWIDISKCFVVMSMCDNQLQPNGCQIHNLFCCGGGSVITEHTEYWNDLV
jgi:hypothetical protein